MPKWIKKIDPASLIDDDIFELLELENAPAERKQKIIEDMMETIQNRVLARILDGLDKSNQEAFEQMLAKDSDEKIDQFLDQKGLSLDQITTEEAIRYKVEIINLIAAKEVIDDETNNQPASE